MNVLVYMEMELKRHIISRMTEKKGVKFDVIAWETLATEG